MYGLYRYVPRDRVGFSVLKQHGQVFALIPPSPSLSYLSFLSKYIPQFYFCTVEFKQKKCLSTRASRTAAVLVGIFLAAVAVLSAYAAGAFNSNPDLPEIMEGEATFTADDGKGEVFHVMIDYKRKLIQLTSLNDLAASPQLFGRRLMSYEENNTANGTRMNATKIVIQDYNAVSFNAIPNLQQSYYRKRKKTNKRKKSPNTLKYKRPGAEVNIK